MGLIHVGNVCGWYACRLWGIHMLSFSLSICTPPHTHTHTPIRTNEDGRRVCLAAKISAPSTQHILFRNISSHISLTPSTTFISLSLSLPGSDTEFFLTAVHSLQQPCNPHILYTPCTLFSPPPLYSTLSLPPRHTSEIKTVYESTSSSRPGLSLKTR